jgi:AraC-like DNA-binding protein
LAEPLRLRNLRLPFVIQLIARRGAHRLAGRGRAGILVEGTSLVVPAYRSLHYEGAVIIDAKAGHELHLLICDETPAADLYVHRGLALPLRRANVDLALTTRLARAVFLNPAAGWTPALAAEHAGMTIRGLSAQLFREGGAVTTIVREQRLMRALLLLLTPQPARADSRPLATQVGFAPHARFDAMFSRHFGFGAAQLAQRAWCPALTWSMAPGLRL